jgi:hypothetical protein
MCHAEYPGEPPLVVDRLDSHGSLLPVISSRHAREKIIPDIEALRFPPDLITNPLELAVAAGHEPLAYDERQLRRAADKDGVLDIITDDLATSWGYADRNFTPEIAGTVGVWISDFLQRRGLIEEPLSLEDYGKMFQTGWFGEILNDMALTKRNGSLTFVHDDSAGDPHIEPDPEEKIRSSLELDPEDELFDIEVEAESGLYILGVTERVRATLRAKMTEVGGDAVRKEKSVGCPVARTAITATQAQADFLEEHGHLGEASGFSVNRTLDSGNVLLTQGAYTAADDVAFHWGDYVSRYATHWIARGETDGVQTTAANQIVLLDAA